MRGQLRSNFWFLLLVGVFFTVVGYIHIWTVQDSRSNESCVLNQQILFGRVEVHYSAIFLIVSTLIFLLIFAIGKREKISRLELFLYSMVILGGIGNGVERIVAGSICDYYSLLGILHFNIPDLLISIGVLLLIILYLLDYNESINKNSLKG